MPPSMPMMGATTARSPRLERAEEEHEAADLEHAREHGVAERPEVVVRRACRRAPARAGIVQRPLPTSITSDARYGSTLRLSGTSQKLSGGPGERREQAESDRHAAATVSAWPRSPIPMPSRSRASSSATRPCSRSPARASRPPAGCPTSARPGGLWERLDPMVDGHVDMLARDPARVWQCWAEPLVGASIAHNPAHDALARLEAGGFLSGVVTQNIDGLHHAAGQRRDRGARSSAQRALHALRRRGGDGAGARALRREPARARVPASCGGTLRPQVVLFGEPLPASAWGLAAALVAELRGVPLRRHVAAGLSGGRPGRGVRARRGGRSRSSRARRRRSGRTPIRGCCARPRTLLPAVASILLTEPPDSRFTLKLRQEALRAGQDPSQPFQRRRAM